MKKRLLFTFWLILTSHVQPALAIVGAFEEPSSAMRRASLVVLREGGGVCTGVVITPSVILTAAHCTGTKAAGVRVHYRDENGQPILLEASAIVRHPGYREKAVAERTSSIDLSLIRLAAPLASRFSVASLSTRVPQAGDRIRVAGFGVSKETDKDSVGTLRTTSLTTISPYGPSRLLVWLRAENKSMRGACYGDSGGPVTADDRGVFAVISWTTGKNGTHCGDITQGTLLGPHQEWIDTSLGRWSEKARWE